MHHPCSACVVLCVDSSISVDRSVAELTSISNQAPEKAVLPTEGSGGEVEWGSV